MAAIEEPKNLAERDGHPIKVLRLDYGGELHSTEFEEWAKRNNIELQHSSPGNSEQNGMAERPLRTLTEGTAASLLHGNINRRLWGEGWKTFNYLKNRLPSSTRELLTPFEIYHGYKPDMHKLIPFGCATYARIPDQQRRKADMTTCTGRARACIMLGYDETTKDSYKLLNLATDKVIHSRSVTFIADDFPLKHRHDSKFRRDDSDPPSFELTPATSTAPTTTPATPTATTSVPPSTATSASPDPTPADPTPRKSNRVTAEVFRFNPQDYSNDAFSAGSDYDDFEEPSTVKQAMERHDWQELALSELSWSSLRRYTYDLRACESTCNSRSFGSKGFACPGLCFSAQII